MKESILVTGVAGFIGFHVAQALMEEGAFVVGVDNLCDYYDVSLKEARLAALRKNFPHQFSFEKVDISDRGAMQQVWRNASLERPILQVVHLAAQAGVRHSLEDPYIYVQTNVMGHLVLLECARYQKDFRHFVYASSSSVYGGNKEMPFSEDHRVDLPLAVYAATKRADELMSRSYAHLFKLPLTGLRFFSVYGPWGRPDMALFIFTKKILAGDPISVFNEGKMQRDFTYVDDIVAGVVAALKSPPAGQVPHAVYNLGNSKSEPLMRYIQCIEQELGKKARCVYEPMQPGDVPDSTADITAAKNAFGFSPKTNIDLGIKNFVSWYRTYYNV